jgi:hypothetical protein
MPTPAQLADLTARMASVIELHVRCQCESLNSWPWRREVLCGRCQILEEWKELATDTAAVPVAKKEKVE